MLDRRIIGCPRIKGIDKTIAQSYTENSKPQRHRALDDAKLGAMIWLEMGKM
jgi:inhibitor of KinA sporulation pathway (predicted exonuclease)